MIRWLRALVARYRGHWVYDVGRVSPCLDEWHCACGGAALVWHSRARASHAILRSTCSELRPRAERIPRAIACHCSKTPGEDRW